MPRELILHIGTFKTGSTSIQNALLGHGEKLLTQGAFYPTTAGQNRHVKLALAFTSFKNQVMEAEGDGTTGKVTAAAIQEFLRELSAEILALPPEVTRVILSAEQFSTFQRDHEDLCRLRDFLAPFFDSISVIVYLRRQDAHFGSLYSQFLRWGRIDTPDTDDWRTLNHDYDYAELLERWGRVFGDGAMRPRVFERGIDRKFDVVEDFAALCGLHLTAAPKSSAAKSNLSMNVAGQQVLLDVGRAIQVQTGKKNVGSAVWHQLATAVTATSPGSGWQLTRSQARDFMEFFRETNEAVRSRWFPDRQTLFSEDYGNLPEEPSLRDAQAELHAARSALLYTVESAIKREQKLHLRKARLANKLGDRQTALASMVQAVHCDGSDASVRIDLANMFIKDGNMHAAVPHAEAALLLAPESIRARGLQKRLRRLGKAAG